MVKSNNYEKITSFKYDKKDFISARIISFYQEYLFGNIYNASNKNKEKIDEIIGEYVDRTKFFEYVQEKLTDIEGSNTDIDYYQNLDVNLKKLYKEFSEVVYVSTTKWL